MLASSSFVALSLSSLTTQTSMESFTSSLVVLATKQAKCDTHAEGGRRLVSVKPHDARIRVVKSHRQDRQDHFELGQEASRVVGHLWPAQKWCIVREA